MLEAQLNAARQARRQRNLKIAVSAGAVILIGGVALMFATSCCGLDEKDVAEVADDIKPAVPTVTATPTKQKDTAARESYLQLLKEYRNDIEPELASIDLQRWQPAKKRQLSDTMDAALTAFTAADYAAALENLQSATSLADTLLQQRAEQFQQAMAEAMSAYEQDRYEEAKQHIDQALMLNTASSEARTLADRIETLGELLPLLNEAQVARTENNPRKELAVIEQVLQVAPERETARQRQQELQRVISLQDFQSHLDRAYAAIERQDAAVARKHINSARQIYPNRSEISDVTQALQRLEKQQRIASYSNQALQAMREDDWLAAREQLTRALSERPDDKTLQDLLEKTESILSLKQRIGHHLAYPYRLANAPVRSDAAALLETAQAYRPASPSLDEEARELASVMDKMDKKVSVKVISDNKTNVLVRGVGVVGVTESKTIELPPGEYRFEGKRPGYKSKLIKVLVPFDKNSMQLTVICDEPI